MLIETVMFGNIEVDKEQIITFPEGIIGFDHLKRYTLISIDEDSPFNWLQAVDEPPICFLIIEPTVFKTDYKISLTKENLFSLQAEDLKGLLTVVIVSVPEDPKLMTANMKGPIIINSKTNLAKQIALNDDAYTTRQPILNVLNKT